MNKYKRLKKIINHKQFNKNTKAVDIIRLIDGDLRQIGDAIVEGKEILFNCVTPPGSLTFTEPAKNYSIKKPTVNINGKEPNTTQLTKREQFAMAAMQSLASCPDNYDAIDVPSLAVSMADTLLAELERG